MRIRAALLLALVAASLAALTGKGNTLGGGSGSAATSIPLISPGDLKLSDIFGETIYVKTDQPSTISLQIVASNADTFDPLLIAGGASSRSGLFSSLSSSLGGSPAVSFDVTVNVPTTIYITMNITGFVRSTDAKLSVALLAGFNEATAKDVVVYGALASSVSGNAYTYTIPVGFKGPLYLVAINTTTTSSVGGQSSQGSDAFNYENLFYPVSYSSNFALTNGQQYAYGSNIIATPASSSATTLNITYIGGFAGSPFSISSASSAPNSAGGSFYGYYSIAGTPTVIQFQVSKGQTSTFRVGNGTYVNTSEWLDQANRTISWFEARKSATSAALPGDWSRVSGAVMVQGNNGANTFSVWTTTTNRNSQWTVGAGGTASAMTYSVAVIIALIGLVLA